jgi:hypothetical protein
MALGEKQLGISKIILNVAYPKKEKMEHSISLNSKKWEAKSVEQEASDPTTSK